MSGHRAYKRGGNEARHDRIASDAMGAKLLRDRARQPDEACLAGRITRLTQPGALGCYRRDVHNTAPLSSDHRWRYRLDAVEGAGEVHCELVLPTLERHFSDRRDVVHDAGRVHQNVRRTEAGHCGLERVVDAAAIGDVYGDGHRPPAR